MAFDGIDLLKLFAGDLPGFHDDYKQVPLDARTANFDASKSKKLLTSHDRWNNWLKKCEDQRNINELAHVRRQLQVGMAEVVKKRLNNDLLSEMFVRWQSSIEKTAKRIIKKKYPLPPAGHEYFNEYLKAKRHREKELQKFWEQSAY